MNFVIKRQYLVIGLVLSLAMALQGSNHEKGTITGTIKDPTGAVVPQAAIHIHVWPRITHSLSADSQGRFRIELTPGVYDVLIAYPTMLPVVERVRVSSGKTHEISKKLKFDPKAEVITLGASR